MATAPTPPPLPLPPLAVHAASTHLSAEHKHADSHQVIAVATEPVDRSGLATQRVAVCLEFCNVEYTVAAGSTPDDGDACNPAVAANADGGVRRILHGISGAAKPGTLTAIMGPSGSGKSTLVDILAARKSSGAVSGQIAVNGRARGANFKAYTGYVTQEDVLVPTATVQETLQYYADLRLPTTTSRDDKRALVASVLHTLGLTPLAHSYVGGVLPGGRKLPGLSGGEKRRLTIGCALVTNPSLLILDEPTSGLDAAAAYSVVQNLMELAKDGRTVVATIHQPRSKIFSAFDQIIVLARGHAIYSGPPLGILPFVEELTCLPSPAPRFDRMSNVADYVLDFIAALRETDVLAVRNEFDRSRAASSASAIVVSSPAADFKAGGSSADALDAYGGDAPGYFDRFGVLLRRARQIFWRNVANFVVRVAAAAVVGVLLALPSTALALNDYETRIRVIYGILQTATLLPFAALGLFMGSRVLFNSERASELYGASEYYLAQVVMESVVSCLSALAFGNILYFVPGLNPALDRYGYAMAVTVLTYLITDTMAITMANAMPNSDMAFSIGGAVMTIWFGYAGFFIKLDRLPQIVAWIRWLNPLRFSFEALVRNEFEGVVYDCPWDRAAVGLCTPNGNAVIDALGFDPFPSDKYTPCGFLFLYLVVWHLLAYLCLKYLHKEKR